jgi:hypothetical protein
VAACVRNLGIILFLLLSAAPSRTAAAAAACALRREAGLAVTLLNGVPLVAATINGVATTMILDTGAEDTVLTTAAAARLGLEDQYAYPQDLLGVSGGLATGQAMVARLALGAAGVRDFILLVGSLSLPNPDGVQPAGLLGSDFLSHFDVDLDLYDGRLALYRQGCASVRPPWHADAAIVANRSIDNRLFFPVALDGRRLFAFIDTGAQISTIDRKAVLGLGISPAAIARDPVAMMRGVVPNRVQAHAHRFAWLRVGDVIWRNPVMIVTDLNLPDADIVLGIDFLRRRRVWFSYAAHRIFLGRPNGR